MLQNEQLLTEASAKRLPPGRRQITQADANRLPQAEQPMAKIDTMHLRPKKQPMAKVDTMHLPPKKQPMAEADTMRWLQEKQEAPEALVSQVVCAGLGNIMHQDAEKHSGIGNTVAMGQGQAVQAILSNASTTARPANLSSTPGQLEFNTMSRSRLVAKGRQP